MAGLDRLFRPKSVAVIGGGYWARSIIEQCRKIAFQGAIYPIHPKATDVDGSAGRRGAGGALSRVARRGGGGIDRRVGGERSASAHDGSAAHVPGRREGGQVVGRGRESEGEGGGGGVLS